MSKDNLDKVAAASAKLETKTDYYGAKWLAWPYSWIPAVIVAGLAVKGVISIL